MRLSDFSIFNLREYSPKVQEKYCGKYLEIVTGCTPVAFDKSFSERVSSQRSLRISEIVFSHSGKLEIFLGEEAIKFSRSIFIEESESASFAVSSL